MPSHNKPSQNPEDILQTGRLRFIWREATKGNFQPGLDAGISQENMEKLATISEKELDILAENVDVIFRDIDLETEEIIP